MTAPKGTFWWSTIIKEATITVAPEFSVSGGGGWPGPLQIDVAPSFAFDGNGQVPAEFTIAVLLQGPAFLLEGQEEGGPFTITVAPAFAAAAGPGYPAEATITTAPEFDFAGAEQYPRGVTISIPPDADFAGTGVSAPMFDAAGPGKVFEDVGSASWTHTATAGADVFVEIVSVDSAVDGVTYDGQAMTLVHSMWANNSSGSDTRLLCYRKSNVAGGAKTVAVDFASTSMGCGNSVSILNVGAVSTQTVYGNGDSMSQSVTVGLGQFVLQAFGTHNYQMESLSGGTNRYNGPGHFAQGGLVVNTATASATFTAITDWDTEWAGHAHTLTAP